MMRNKRVGKTTTIRKSFLCVCRKICLSHSWRSITFNLSSLKELSIIIIIMGNFINFKTSVQNVEWMGWKSFLIITSITEQHPELYRTERERERVQRKLNFSHFQVTKKIKAILPPAYFVSWRTTFHPHIEQKPVRELLSGRQQIFSTFISTH